jgi:toxin FitB
MSYLVDTNVYSAVIRPDPDEQVEAWLAEHESDVYTSALTIAELAYGVERLPQGRKRVRIATGLERLIESMEDRILRFDTRVALVWAQLYTALERSGILLPVTDSYIAAIAKRHGLTIVTHDTKDFSRTGLRTINPFQS